MTTVESQTQQTIQTSTENITQMEEIINTSSTHVLLNSESDISSRDHNESTTTVQTPITTSIEKSTFMEEDQTNANPDKGKSTDQQTNTQQDLPNSIKIVTLNDLFEKQPQISNKAYKGFIPRDSFQPDLSNNDIVTLLKIAFINDSNAFRFDVNVLSTYRYFTIFFRTRDSLDQYIKNSPQSLKNIKIYELTNTSINTLIEQKFKNLDSAVIKVMDIPYNYDTKMLLKHLANKTKSAILDHKEIKKPPKKIPGHNRQGKPNFVNLSYKQLIVRFQKQSGYDYFMQENYWSMEIENFIIRILPGNPEDPEYKKCTSHFYKLTGLPLNTTARDIEPIIKHLHGRTCTFTQTSKYATMKNAYVYVDPKNYPDIVTNAPTLSFSNPNNRTNDHHNNNSQHTSTQQQQYHNTPTNNEMADRIKQLEDQVTNLTNKITNLENAHKHTTTTFTTLQTSHNNMEQNIHTISSRQDQYDTIINKLTANLTKLSDAVTANLTTVKPSKRSSPYEKTSYKQTKKNTTSAPINKNVPPQMTVKLTKLRMTICQAKTKEHSLTMPSMKEL
ncbi:hypothetical protein RhiirC2_786426 [Rhizophagus irregularis]|uniref:Uncharacterized protein n=1 Tax=Rhizophagus irregularis TaxID=588596 RepID=A0A2N1MUC6_9GLOM|nr:hypothetical protein RhiirC2_786426 [Rhizophagus irregularis]